MAGGSSGRRGRPAPVNIWPGWVDALSSLVMVIMFVLMVFVLAQFAMTKILSTNDQALDALTHHVAELGDMLALERKNGEALRGQVSGLQGELATTLARRDALQAENADLTAKSAALNGQLAQLREDAETSASAAAAESARGDLARQQLATLTQQIDALRTQLSAVSEALDLSQKSDADEKVQIADLGRRLNVALASKVAELAKYRSEFFGKLREVLGDRPDIRVEGDRFVFQSEVLFATGSAELGVNGKAELKHVADSLKDIAASVPDQIDWVLRIDGHTDRRPVHSPQFASNWELSSARAIAVVKYLKEQGIPPERLAAAGFAEFQPIEQGTTEAALARNRRIELKLDSR